MRLLARAGRSVDLPCPMFGYSAEPGSSKLLVGIGFGDIPLVGLTRSALDEAIGFSGLLIREAKAADNLLSRQVSCGQADDSLRQDLAVLQPGDGIACRDGDDCLYFFHDGFVRRSGDTNLPIEVRLTNPEHPGLNGALGSAIAPIAAQQGALILHAAAYQRESLSLLFLGASGAGKSALSAAAIASEAQVLSDDRVMVCSQGPNQPVSLHALRRDALFSDDTVALLPARIRRGLRPCAIRGRQKQRLTRDDSPASFTTHTTPSAIVILTPDDRPHHTALQRTDQGTALAAILAASSSLHIGSDGRPSKRQLHTASALTAGSPAFVAKIGSALLDTPATEIQRVERQLQYLLTHDQGTTAGALWRCGSAS